MLLFKALVSVDHEDGLCHDADRRHRPWLRFRLQIEKRSRRGL